MHKHRLAIILGLSLTAQAYAPPDPTALGVGCPGNGESAVFFAGDGSIGITWQEFQDTYAIDTNGDGEINYLPWIRGTFDPTAGGTPCDLLPGGD